MMRLIAILLLSFCTSCQGSSQTFAVFRKGKVMPVVMVTDENTAAMATEFCNLFEQATGYRPATVTKADAKGTPVITIELSTEAVSDGYTFRIFRKDDNITIQAADKQWLKAAVYHFYLYYAGFTGTAADGSFKQVAEINIPAELNYSHTPDFEYREPYFPENFPVDFRNRNMTHTLEETWGLWGHNIGKVITVTKDMLAQSGGKKHPEQFCFSSPELEQALDAYINREVRENPARHKFMVMPNDNAVACQCSRCTAVGNTQANASPAVFSLLNRLAKKHPQQQFYSTAYITTQSPPQFSLEPNAGVIISTMAFPKGVVIENSPKKNTVDAVFKSWKKVTGRLYLWDYAVNFDNYFDFYPMVSISQQNLQYYENKGVMGIFMHGSEEQYSAMSGLKCFLYAQLLQDTNADLNYLASTYLQNTFPVTGMILYDYYSAIERAALQSSKPLDIYGGIVPSIKKYLDNKALSAAYVQITKLLPSVSDAEKKQLQPLLAAMAFQQLEIMHVNAFEDNGYATFNYDNSTAAIKPAVKNLLVDLEQYAAAGDITVYNESGRTVADYVASWNTYITGRPYKNLFYGRKFTSVKGVDEDYQPGMLNDGNIGFTDYYNNWLVASRGNLSVTLPAQEIKGANTIEVGLLKDERHNIYLPQKVLVIIEGRRYESNVDAGDGALTKVTVTIPVEIKPTDKNITVELVKRKGLENKAVACDEIYFK